MRRLSRLGWLGRSDLRLKKPNHNIGAEIILECAYQPNGDFDPMTPGSVIIMLIQYQFSYLDSIRFPTMPLAIEPDLYPLSYCFTKFKVALYSIFCVNLYR